MEGSGDGGKWVGYLVVVVVVLGLVLIKNADTLGRYLLAPQSSNSVHNLRTYIGEVPSPLIQIELDTSSI